MKMNKNGKRYDTDNCRDIATLNHRNYNNNYSGTTHLGVASDGQLLKWRITNGQDLYLREYAETITQEDAIEDLNGDNWDMNAQQETLAVQLGLIKLID